MDGYEPGPSDPTPMPLRPRVTFPGMFDYLAADLVTTIAGADVGLSGAQAVVAPLHGLTLEPSFGADVAPAIATLPSLDDPSDGGTVAGVLGGLDAGAYDADQQRTELPGPDQAEPPDLLADNPAGEPPPETVTPPWERPEL